MKTLDEIKELNLYKLFGDDAGNFCQKCPSFTEEKLIDFMSERWTYNSVNLFEAVLNQVKAIDKPQNDLRKPIPNLAEALEELNTAYNYGRDTGINGFLWNADASEFLQKNEYAIMDWLDEFADEYGESVGKVVENLDKNNEAIKDLLFYDGERTKALIARQLMYEVAGNLCETRIEDLIEAEVLDEKEVQKFVNGNAQIRKQQ